MNEPLIPNVPFLAREPKDTDDLARWSKETQEAIRENYRVTQKRLEELNLTGAPGGRPTAIGSRRMYWNDETDQLEHDPSGNWRTVGDPRPDIVQGRLTVQSGAPVPTSDVSGGSMYYTPYTGDKIALLDPNNKNLLPIDAADMIEESRGSLWATFNTATITYSSTNPWHGRTCLQVTTGGVAVAEGIQLGWSGSSPVARVGVTAGQRYTLSTYIRTSAGTALLQNYVYWYNAAGVAIGSSAGSPFTATTAWGRYGDTNMLAPAGATSASIFLVTNWGGPVQAVTFYVDAVQLEPGLYPTAWVPGRAWRTIRFNETSRALAGLTVAGLCYDVFGYIDANGNLALEVVAWASGSARSFPLVRVSGAWCWSSDVTRRYLGTFYCPVNGEAYDYRQIRYLFNCYNRVNRQLLRQDSSAHVYAGAAARVWNNDGNNAVGWVDGLQEEAVTLTLNGTINPVAGETGILYISSAGTVLCTLIASSAGIGFGLGGAAVYPPPLGVQLAYAYEQCVVGGLGCTWDWLRITGTLRM